MKNSLTDFADLFRNFYRGSESEKFDFTFWYQSPSRCSGFQNWATNRNSEKCSERRGAYMIVLNIYSDILPTAVLIFTWVSTSAKLAN